MKVKKINPEWFPSENRELKVGDTAEITDPKALIVAGDVIGLAEDGITELSAYELYGVIIKSEAEEFEEYMRVKKAEATATALKKQEAELKAELKPQPETQTVTPVEVVETVKEESAPKEVEVIQPIVVAPVETPKKK